MTAVDPWTQEGGPDPWDGFPTAEGAPGDVPADNEDEAPHSWRALDLTDVLEGRAVRPTASVGYRSDGASVLYRGKVHTISGESESGKTWFAVAVIVAELEAGHSAVVIDFEDDEIGWVGRLVDAGARVEDLKERFAYIRPTESLGLTGKIDLAPTLQLPDLSIVVVDGITEAMTLFGLDPISNPDVARFGIQLPRMLARRGPAVLCSDHLAKSKPGEGGSKRYALGAVHKLNGLDGAAFIIDNRRPFGVGRKGVSTVSLAKDRPGDLRRIARPSKDLDWFADLVVTSTVGEPLSVELEAPPAPVHDPAGGESGPLVFRPTIIMAKVADILAAAPGPLGRKELEVRVQGCSTANRRLAIDLLIEEGFIVTSAAPRNRTNHTLTRPFTEGRDA